MSHRLLCSLLGTLTLATGVTAGCGGDDDPPPATPDKLWIAPRDAEFNLHLVDRQPFFF